MKKWLGIGLLFETSDCGLDLQDSKESARKGFAGSWS